MGRPEKWFLTVRPRWWARASFLAGSGVVVFFGSGTLLNHTGERQARDIEFRAMRDAAGVWHPVEKAAVVVDGQVVPYMTGMVRIVTSPGIGWADRSLEFFHYGFEEIPQSRPGGAVIRNYGRDEVLVVWADLIATERVPTSSDLDDALKRVSAGEMSFRMGMWVRVLYALMMGGGIALVMGAVGLRVWRSMRRRELWRQHGAISAGECSRCGYPVPRSADEMRCPECGTGLAALRREIEAELGYKLS